MCESCEWSVGRREFMLAASAIGASAALGVTISKAADEKPVLEPLPKKPVRVAVVFLYPPADIVYAGQNEDNWRGHKWFTWPGNQFEPEKQQAKFTQKLQEMAKKLDIQLAIHPQSIYQQAKVREYIAQTKAGGFDAVLVINFWNTFAGWSYQIATEAAPRAIVYQPVGSNHQLPMRNLMTTPGIYYIHSIENWQELENALRAVRAIKMLAQSRLLRITGVKEVSQQQEKDLGTELVTAPAEEYNALFDSTKITPEMEQFAQQIKSQAAKVMDVSDKYIVEAIRAHKTVLGMMQRYGADAITIACLFLKERKPCVSFAFNNGQLVPSGCENDLNGALSLMLGRWLWDRAGFIHNPEFDTNENFYFASHCTCAWKLHGPDGPSQPYIIRPFFHQAPPTAALDVQWTPDEPIVLCKYLSGKKQVVGWTGRVINSPTCPPVGGCATRVLVELDKVDDVCSVYAGPHPTLFCATPKQARALKAFARLSKFEFVGNV